MGQDQSNRYNVERVEFPWIGGTGALSGVPVLRICLRAQPSDGMAVYSGHQLTERISQALEQSGHRITWALLCGDEAAFDSQLQTFLHMHLKLRVCADVSGEAPLTDQGRHHLLFDHVCVRLKAGASRISNGILFHSVCAPMPSTRRQWDAIRAVSDQLDHSEAKVQRFLLPIGEVGVDDVEKVCSLGRGWRLAAPVLTAAECRSVIRRRGKVVVGGSDAHPDSGVP